MSLAQNIDESYGKPLIILIEQNPWLMVIGSDTPTFVLYEKGQIIYKRKQDKTVTIYEVKLSPDALKKVIDSFDITEPFYKLPDQISVSAWTDQPTNRLIVRTTTVKKIAVYGNLRGTFQNGETAPPADFMNVYNKLINFRYDSEKIWEPQLMEVMLWGYSYAPNKKPWPKTLPDLNATATRKFPGGMYSVFIERSQFDELRNFYASLGEKTAVEINGKKMAISVRYPFPNMN
jgi:hypothetical protein